jgi:hypothetical protein
MSVIFSPKQSVPPLKPEHLSLIGEALEAPFAEGHESFSVLFTQLARESRNDDACACEPSEEIE